MVLGSRISRISEVSRIANTPRALADNWYPIGGVDQWVKIGGGSRHQDFFSSPGVISAFKDHISYLGNRVNVFNKKKYSEDPTIAVWNLANEARCQGCDSSVMQAWIGDVCGHLKSVMPHGLVSIGCDFAAAAPAPCSPARSQLRGLLRAGHEDGAQPAGRLGAERGPGLPEQQPPRLRGHCGPARCVCATASPSRARFSHPLCAVWPDNWGDAAKSPAFQQAYIRSHLADVAANLKKVRSFLRWP